MSTQYHINVFIEESDDAAQLLRDTDLILSQSGATLDVPTVVQLDDWDEEEPLEARSATGIDEVVQHLAPWPALGTIDYSLRKTLYFHVGFTRLPAGILLVWIAFDGKHFHKHPESLPHVVRLIHALHEGLNAVRSSFDWGLSDNYVENEDDEAERLSSGIVVGTPWLDLLRRDLATPEHFEWLSSQRGSQTTLQRTASGGLVWQRDASPP